MGERLQNKVALVTGGASGIARGIVKQFVAEGAKVVVADIQTDKGLQLQSRYPGAVTFQLCDIEREEDIGQVVARTCALHGGLDILVHAAAAVKHKHGIADITSEIWDEGQGNLLRSNVLCIKHAIAPMEQRGGGSIILFSSASADSFTPAASVTYVVCKGAVLYLTRWAAFDLAKKRIRVNAIIPGAFATPLWGDLVNAPKDVADRMPEHLDELMASWQPYPKPGSYADIANAATFLASPESEFITGVSLSVDGGLALYPPRASNEFVFQHLTAAKQKAEQDVAREQAGPKSGE